MNVMKVNADDLVVVGRKRDWVPMWFYLNVMVRFGFWDVWPFGYRVKGAESAGGIE